MTLTKEEFKQIRKDLGMTQAEFAKEIGLGDRSGQIHVSNIERGEQPISGMITASVRMIERLMLQN